MRRMAILTLFLAGCGPVPMPAPPAPGPVAPAARIDPVTAPAELAKFINAERARARLPALRRDPRLEKAASAWAKQIAARDRLDHFGPDDSTPWTRIAAAGYPWSAASENVGWNERTPAEAVSAWMASPGHRANILGPYRDVGGAVAVGKSGPYWVVDFGTPR